MPEPLADLSEPTIVSVDLVGSEFDPMTARQLIDNLGLVEAHIGDHPDVARRMVLYLIESLERKGVR